MLQWHVTPLSGRPDPYLAWTEDTGWQGHGAARSPHALIPVLIELTDAARKQRIDDLAIVRSGLAAVPGLYRSPVGNGTRSRFLTAFVERDRLGDLATHTEEVVRFEFSLPVDAGGPAENRSPPGAIESVVIGVIDRGCAFLNRAFRRAWQDEGADHTRIVALWDQTRPATGRYWKRPAAAGYGRELVARDIDRLIARVNAGDPESRIYEELGHPLDARGLTVDRVHGTHVLDVAAGLVPLQPIASSAKPERADFAQTCPIVFVSVPALAAGDFTGASTNAYVLDGMRYILQQAGPGARVVINLSIGNQGGPHDGTALIDEAIDELIRTHSKLAVTVAAGNAADEHWSATGTASRNAPAMLRWRVMPDDDTDSFLELWLQPAGRGRGKSACAATLTVTPPFPCPASPAVAAGDSALLRDDGHRPVARLSVLADSALGQGPVALLALAPTHGPRGTAPAGVWTVTLATEGTEPTSYDAWIQRDAPPFGSDDPVQSAFDGQAEDQAGQGNPINNLACGPRVIVVGANRLSDAVESNYSSRPHPTSRSSRVKTDVDLLAPADESATAIGLFCAGTLSGTVFRAGGTSISAPIAARHIANQWLAAADPAQRAPSAALNALTLKKLALGAPIPWPPPRGRRKPVLDRG